MLNIIFKCYAYRDEKERDIYELKILKLRKRIALHRRIEEIQKKEDDIEYRKIKLREIRELDIRKKKKITDRLNLNNMDSMNDINDSRYLLHYYFEHNFFFSSKFRFIF